MELWRSGWLAQYRTCICRRRYPTKLVNKMRGNHFSQSNWRYKSGVLASGDSIPHHPNISNQLLLFRKLCKLHFCYLVLELSEFSLSEFLIYNKLFVILHVLLVLLVDYSSINWLILLLKVVFRLLLLLLLLEMTKVNNEFSFSIDLLLIIILLFLIN